MRTAPVALAHLGDDAAIARAAGEISALTHSDPVAKEACVLWCLAIDRAVREQHLNARAGLEFLDPGGQERWNRWIDEAEQLPPATFSPNGYVVTAFQAAWSAISQTPVPSDVPCHHLQHALHAAVRIGHDTDTVAAIAGGLLGARWGMTAIPLRWQAMLQGWPGLRARELARLAILGARAGEADDIGWPAASDLRTQYTRTWGIEPFSVALPHDDGVVLGNAASAAHAETDVLLSLCRMGAASPQGVGEHHEVMLLDSQGPGENPNLDFVLRDLASTIAGWREAGRTVFVHCVAGISRTPTVGAAYLATHLGIPGLDALELILDVHPDGNPRPLFREALGRL